MLGAIHKASEGLLALSYLHSIVLCLASACAVACGDNIPGRLQPDGSTGLRPDASVPMPDAKEPTPDAMDPTADAAVPSGIDEARAAPDGVVDPPIVVENVLVTYTKEAFSIFEPAGFFIQGQPTGPALFIEITDPSMLIPPSVGDSVSFEIRQMATVGRVRWATEIGPITVNSQGNDVSSLIQDISSATDVVTALAEYESELVAIDATVSSDFSRSGSGYVAASIDSSGISGETLFRLRLPDVLQDELALTSGCTVRIAGTPLWRSFSVANVHLEGIADIDITVSSCPVSTRTIQAMAISETQVRLTLSRGVDATSVTTDGTQFTIDNGASVSEAVVAGRDVILTTSTQTPGTLYTVTIDDTIRDVLGVAIDTADGANVTRFSGWDTSGIDNARQAADGTTDISLSGVFVTYIKPEAGSEPAGFFVQAHRVGPALFVAVDPSTLSPSPAIGDEIDIAIAEMSSADGMRRATAASSVAINSSGNDLSSLTQDVSDVDDLVRALDTYESELIRIQATVVADFVDAGDSYVTASIESAGVSGDLDLQLRQPATVQERTNLLDTCVVDVVGTPLWRLFDTAQVHIGDPGDIETAACPAPLVEDALASSSMELRIAFDREIDPASIVDPATQFVIEQGLTVSGASVDGRSVTLATGLQTEDEIYTVTVADTITDIFGAGVDPLNNSLSFRGFVKRATLRVNEVYADDHECDLIELRVVSSGSLNRIKVFHRVTELITFDPAIVFTNDLIVVHTNGDIARCNPGNSSSETSAIDEFPSSSFGANYDTAFDWYTNNDDLSRSDNVVTVIDPFDNIQDAVFVTDAPTGPTVNETEIQAEIVRAAGEWTVTFGPPPGPGFFRGTNFNLHAALDLNLASGSIQRIDDDDTNTKADWSTPDGNANPAFTFGLLNVGQSPLP